MSTTALSPANTTQTEHRSARIWVVLAVLALAVALVATLAVRAWTSDSSGTSTDVRTPGYGLTCPPHGGPC